MDSELQNIVKFLGKACREAVEEEAVEEEAVYDEPESYTLEAILDELRAIRGVLERLNGNFIKAFVD